MARDHVHDLVLNKGGDDEVEIRDLGRRDYVDTLVLQHALARARAEGVSSDTILLVEHERVITVGRRGHGDGFAPGDAVPIVEVERGGEATFHGPGQAVVYPIVYLEEGRRDLHAFLRGLEEAVIATLAPFGVTGERVPGKTGVFVSGKKVASIGIAVSRWVTYHGVALNVAMDLSGFKGFTPCGLPPETMGNVGPLLPKGLTSHDVGLILAENVARFVAALSG